MGNNETESVREREKRVENERIQKLKKSVRNSEGEFLTCSEYPLVVELLHCGKQQYLPPLPESFDITASIIN